MHYLLRESALFISKEERLVVVAEGKKEVEDNGIRRYSIEVRNKEINPGGKGMSQLRSLLIFAVDEISKSSLNELPSGLKLLRVLDLENAAINELPVEVGHLFNLRYLNLTRTQVKELPKSIGTLINMQTLVLKYTKIEKLRNEIVKLQNLRYLIATYLLNVEIDPRLQFFRSVQVTPNIFMMKSLQILYNVQVSGTLISKQLGDMTRLTRLGLDGIKEANEKDLCSSLERMKNLRRLSLSSGYSNVPLKLDALLSASPYLETLSLWAKLEKVPHWFKTLLNLIYLNLEQSTLEEDMLTHIQAFPNLSQLTFSYNAFQGERLCYVEGFPKLKFLQIRGCPNLKEIMMGKGVMPGLQELRLFRCKELRRLADGWDENLTHLGEVRLYDVSNELVQSICGELGNGDLPTTPYILLTRLTTDDDGNDGEAKSKWVPNILNQ